MRGRLRRVRRWRQRRLPFNAEINGRPPAAFGRPDKRVVRATQLLRRTECEGYRETIHCVPMGRDILRDRPGDEWPGYIRIVPPGRASC